MFVCELSHMDEPTKRSQLGIFMTTDIPLPVGAVGGRRHCSGGARKEQQERRYSHVSSLGTNLRRQLSPAGAKNRCVSVAHVWPEQTLGGASKFVSSSME